MRVKLTDDELWQAIAHNTTAMSALVYRRIELDAGSTRNDVIDRAQLMQYAGTDPIVLGESANTITTYGYDPATGMQEAKVTLCQITAA